MERLYIIVDEDLPIGYQAVQSGHATAQWLLTNPNQTWNNSYLIFLKGNLSKLMLKLDMRDEDYVKFNEPDLDNATTAIAKLGNHNLFKNLKKLGEN